MVVAGAEVRAGAGVAAGAGGGTGAAVTPPVRHCSTYCIHRWVDSLDAGEMSVDDFD